MKRWIASTLVLLGLGALPVCAQRGGSRGGSVGRAAPVFRGGPVGRGGVGFSGGRVPVGRRPGVPFRRGVFGGPLVGGWIGAGYLGYPETYIDAGAGDAQAYAAQPEYAPPAEYGGQYPVAPAPYVEPAPPPQRRVEEPLRDEDAVTIVFKDGRAPMEIHNYALTRTTLYVRDQRHRDIPLDEVNIPATVKANHEAGVDFQVPGAK
jgi:hypothetical protein